MFGSLAWLKDYFSKALMDGLVIHSRGLISGLALCQGWVSIGPAII